MKKILIITYYWPPSGGAAVQRWLSFANGLAENKYSVFVLTVQEKSATYQLTDQSLVKEVHPAIRVSATKTREPFGVFTFFFGKKNMPKPAFSNETSSSPVKKLARFIRGNFFIPDPRKGWRQYAVKEATAIIQREKIKCVITAGPPHSTHFIGKELKEKFSVYWIADFHDLWTDVIYYHLLYHLPIVKKMDKKLERTILEAADEVITVGEKYKEKLLSKSDKLAAEKVKILRIGYDEKLFQAVPDAKVQERFIITYTGTIADFYEPGIFIDALKEVAGRFPEVSFCLQFAGVLSEGIRNKIVDAGLKSTLEDLGYLSHKASVDLLKTATVLLLVNPVTKDEEMVIPGKIYEYLAAGKPIINICTSNAETATIIESCEAGRTFNRNEKKELEDYLSSLVLHWKKDHQLTLKNNSALISTYSRNAITRELINIIDDKT